MYYSTSLIAIVVFMFFVAVVLGLSFYLARRGQTAKGYYAAHGQIHWAVNGVAFAGDYLSAASFLGICGLIASYGYDGFLYSIGYLAGWVVALFVIAEPIKRLGKFTFADALDSCYDSRAIKLAVAISTLAISAFYLIPQMVGAGALITPLLGLPHYAGVLIVGITVTLIVVTAGMVSTTWVQFIKGFLLVLFCAALTTMILSRGFTATPVESPWNPEAMRADVGEKMWDKGIQLDENAWPGKPYVKAISSEGVESVMRVTDAGWITTQSVTIKPDGTRLVNGRTQSRDHDLSPVGTIARLPGDVERTGPVGPVEFFDILRQSEITTWTKEDLKSEDGTRTAVYYPVQRSGADLLKPGGYFKGMTSPNFTEKLDFISLMLALFCGTASLPHILIRYYTVKDQASARKSTVVGIAAIGFFYVLTLYLGFGAMTSGAMDVTDNNMSAPLLARSFSELMFAIISAIAFTTVLGTVSGLIMAGSGAVAHDLLENFFRIPMNDHQKVLYGKFAALLLGVGAMVLGVLFKNFNVSFLVGWAFNIAASANLPALVMMLFWRRTTKQGIAAAVFVGMTTSLLWILLSGDTYAKVYGWDPKTSIIPFSQPALVTIPLGFLVLIGVSLITPKPAHSVAEELAEG
ncbi:MAG: cation acetate symporter [Candidatus Hydrogenedentes bacterium]|nr:cation acetate symporter [Candidatus Hydrogenedentota bacterium]